MAHWSNAETTLFSVAGAGGKGPSKNTLTATTFSGRAASCRRASLQTAIVTDTKATESHHQQRTLFQRLQLELGGVKRRFSHDSVIGRLDDTQDHNDNKTRSRPRSSVVEQTLLEEAAEDDQHPDACCPSEAKEIMLSAGVQASHYGDRGGGSDRTAASPTEDRDERYVTAEIPLSEQG